MSQSLTDQFQKPASGVLVNRALREDAAPPAATTQPVADAIQNYQPPPEDIDVAIVNHDVEAFKVISGNRGLLIKGTIADASGGLGVAIAGSSQSGYTAEAVARLEEQNRSVRTINFIDNIYQSNTQNRVNAQRNLLRWENELERNQEVGKALRAQRNQALQMQREAQTVVNQKQDVIDDQAQVKAAAVEKQKDTYQDLIDIEAARIESEDTISEAQTQLDDIAKKLGGNAADITLDENGNPLYKGEKLTQFVKDGTITSEQHREARLLAESREAAKRTEQETREARDKKSAEVDKATEAMQNADNKIEQAKTEAAAAIQTANDADDKLNDLDKKIEKNDQSKAEIKEKITESKQEADKYKEIENEREIVNIRMERLKSGAISPQEMLEGNQDKNMLPLSAETQKFLKEHDTDGTFNAENPEYGKVAARDVNDSAYKTAMAAVVQGHGSVPPNSGSATPADGSTYGASTVVAFNDSANGTTLPGQTPENAPTPNKNPAFTVGSGAAGPVA